MRGDYSDSDWKCSRSYRLAQKHFLLCQVSDVLNSHCSVTCSVKPSVFYVLKSVAILIVPTFLHFIPPYLYFYLTYSLSPSPASLTAIPGRVKKNPGLYGFDTAADTPRLDSMLMEMCTK